MTTGHSGPTSRDAFAWFDPGSSCWKMCQASLGLENSGESQAIWPRSGMTSGGFAYELPTSGFVTSAPGSSLLPTPTARDHKGQNQRKDTSCLPGALLAAFPVADNGGLPSDDRNPSPEPLPSP